MKLMYTADTKLFNSMKYTDPKTKRGREDKSFIRDFSLPEIEIFGWLEEKVN